MSLGSNKRHSDMDMNSRHKMKKIGLSEQDTEPVEMDVILNFQKAAIYRQLMEYKRLYESSLEQISLLEESNTLISKEKGQLMELWNLMIQDVKILSNSFPPNTLEIPDHAFIKSISDSMNQNHSISNMSKLVSDLLALMISKLNGTFFP